MYYKIVVVSQSGQHFYFPYKGSDPYTVVNRKMSETNAKDAFCEEIEKVEYTRLVSKNARDIDDQWIGY